MNVKVLFLQPNADCREFFGSMAGELCENNLRNFVKNTVELSNVSSRNPLPMMNLFTCYGLKVVHQNFDTSVRGFQRNVQQI